MDALRLCFGLWMVAAVGMAETVKDVSTLPSRPSLEVKKEGPFQPTWESLAKVEEAPEWFRDAKLGIYFHWGVYTVPAYGTEWYPRMMWRKGEKSYGGTRDFNQYHTDNWGSPDRFGYHDFIPKFTAERFDAKEWVELFKDAGAKFAGPVAEHHDGFSMWASRVNPWNSAAMGPKRDVLGEMTSAARAAGLKVIATFHHEHNFTRQEPDKNGKLVWQGYYGGLMEHYPQVIDGRPDLAMLYGVMRADQFWSLWQDKLTEVIDRYQPDMLWFDSWLHEIPAERRQAFLAHYYNSAASWGRQVAVARKQDDLPLDCSVEDFEKGRAAEIMEKPWLTDDTISAPQGGGSWCWTRDFHVKPLKTVLHGFLDIVSKNGCLLLNLSPKADGSIPGDQRALLHELGQWLRVNGEAVYGTRPFVVAGQGPTKLATGGHFIKEVEYTVDDLRYTTKGDTLYVILLGNPASGKTYKLDAFSAGSPAHGRVIRSASILGSEALPGFRQDVDGTALTIPDHGLKTEALVLRLQLDPR